MSNTNAISLIHNFISDYMERLQNRTLSSIADTLGMELETFDDNMTLALAINRCIFVDLMRHKPFQDVKILAYYVTDDGTHYFALELEGHTMCQSCHTTHPIYATITVSEFEYGLTEFVAHEGNRIRHHNYRTVRDVVSFMEKHTHAMDVPSLL